MDWSLVLASQGIEVEIQRPSQEPSWNLRIAPSDRLKALDAIRRFRLENRRWHWRKAIFGAPLEFHWAALIWVVAITFLFAIQEHFWTLATFDTTAFGRGEWWRMFSAVGLHRDIAHLASNAFFGSLVLGLAMAWYGVSLTLLLTWAAGALGNYLAWRWHPIPYIGIGASGMVMGALGALSAHAVHCWRAGPQATRYILGSLVGGVFLFIQLGTDPKSDIAAHLGGFVGGAFLGAIASWFRWVRFPAVSAILLGILILAVVGSILQRT